MRTVSVNHPVEPAEVVEVTAEPGQAGADPFRPSPDRDLTLQGHYAGFFTRLIAFVIDVIVIVLVTNIVGAASQFLVSTLSGHQFHITELPIVPWLLFTLWAVFYCTYPVAAAGKTLGMAIVGLQVVRPDGSRVGGGRAFVRFIALPLSFITLGVGFLLILLRRDHRALQDLIGRTAVVYAWDARAARIRFLAHDHDGAAESGGTALP
jgi:uncharacterized RDD family membrane protein YckC